MRGVTFGPYSWTRIPLTAAAAVTRVQVRPAGVGAGNFLSCRVVNSGAVVAQIAFGPASVTADANSLEILPGSVETFRIGPDATHVAAIAASSCNLSFTLGDGL